MKVRIHGTFPDGTEDTWVLEGNIEEIKAKARRIIEQRNLINYWSEEVDIN